MSGPTTAPLKINKPGDPDYCASCDRTGLAILVALYGVIPEQNYSVARSQGYDWVTYLEADFTPFFGDFDQNKYLSSRKLADANTFGSSQCSHYVLRRPRKGYLYVYYPSDKTWDLYTVQSDGRLLLMQSDLHHAMGKGDVACARFVSSPSNLLLIVDPKTHPDFWVAFSDAQWTQAVRKDVAANPDQFMKHVVIDGKKNLVSFDGAEFIKNTVLGFQDRPLLQTHDQEAYPRTPMVAPGNIYNALVAHNQPFNATGLMLLLEDDIGIATQLNFERNCALVDIMGEGKGYTEDDRNKMDTAGLLDSIKDIVGDEQWSRMKKHMKSGEFDTFLTKYKKCTDAQADFSSYSHDYTVWMQFLVSRKHYKLFDPNVPAIGLELGRIVADLYEGCGLTQNEFDKVLKPQLAGDVTDPTQLFWRGATANNNKVLTLLVDNSVDKALVEGTKKLTETKEQVNLLTELREAKAEAAERNEASWARLARVIASRAKRLHDQDAKTFRRTIRRIQAVTLTTENMAVLELKVQGDAAAYLQQLRQASMNGGKVKVTPKNSTQIAALSELLVANWKPGQPVPAGLNEATKTLGIGPDELPPSTTMEVGEKGASVSSIHTLIGLNAGLAALKAMAFVASVHELGLDISQTASGKSVDQTRLLKDMFEAGAGLLGAASAGFEIGAAAKQLATGGAKSATFWRLSLLAGGLGFAASIFESAAGVTEAAKLWSEHDKGAGVTKGAGAVLGTTSAATGYMALRMTARAALEAAARQAGLGVAGEAAAELAVASTAARGGAVAASEAPPAAMILTIISGITWAASLFLDIWSKYLTTTPFEKWADRCFLGEHKGKWGHAYTDVKDQLDDILRVFYTVKLEGPSAFGLDNAMEITVPAFGEASELVIMVTADNYSVGHFDISGKGLTSNGVPKLQNLARPPQDLIVHAEAKREDEGLRIEIRVGGEDSKWLEDAKQAGLNILMPWRSTYNTAKGLIKGLPKAKVQYFPNVAAYPRFWVDERSAEEVAEEKEKAVANGKK